MRREEFKEILPIHLETCRNIVKRKMCEAKECQDCPFDKVFKYCVGGYEVTHAREFLSLAEGLEEYTQNTDYYNAKDDREKRKSLMPVEVMPYALNEDNAEKLLWGKIFAHTAYGSVDSNIIISIEKVLQFGAEKYGVNQWQNVPDAQERFKDALMRHTYNDEGEFILDEIDAESGLKHVYHALCNIMFLMWFELKEKK